MDTSSASQNTTYSSWAWKIMPVSEYFLLFLLKKNKVKIRKWKSLYGLNLQLLHAHIFFRKMHIYLSKLNLLAQFCNLMQPLLKEVNGFLILHCRCFTAFCQRVTALLVIMEEIAFKVSGWVKLRVSAFLKLLCCHSLTISVMLVSITLIIKEDFSTIVWG